MQVASTSFVKDVPTALALVDGNGYSFVGPAELPNYDPPQRMALVAESLRATYGERCQGMLPRAASDDELLLCHSPGHVAVFGAEDTDPVRAVVLGHSMDPLVPSQQPQLARAARRSCAAAVDAAMAVATGQCANAFVACRPAGHMVHRASAKGYGVFNNVAVAAAACLKNGAAKRIMIVVRVCFVCVYLCVSCVSVCVSVCSLVLRPPPSFSSLSFFSNKKQQQPCHVMTDSHPPSPRALGLSIVTFAGHCAPSRLRHQRYFHQQPKCAGCVTSPLRPQQLLPVLWRCR